MNKKSQNIHPFLDRILNRSDKEKMLNQHALVFWLTGLSGSGKSTIAIGTEKKLFESGYLTQILDGDNIRIGINNNLGFSDDDRNENIRRIAEVSKLFLNCGIITINSFVSPTIKIRQMAEDIIGKENFKEIYINTPLEICEQRDVKGLYKKAREGIIKDFTGIDAPFDEPENPALEIKTDGQSVEDSIKDLVNFIMPLIQLK